MPPKYSALAYLTIVLSLALILPVLLLLAGNSPAAATSPSALVPTPLEGEQEITPTQHEVAFGQLPLYFIENQGQLDDRVAYYIQGHDKTLYFTQEGITFALSPSLVAEPVLSEVEGEGQGGGFSPSSSEGEGWGGGRYILKLDFLNANPRVRPIGQQPTEAVISYFKGPNDQWHTGLPTYAKLVYPNLWPGIDLVYSGAANRLKYEFVVKPGADPAQIRLAYRGATAVWVNHAGQLEVSTPTGSFHDDTPYAYQEIDGQQIAIPAAYTLDSNPALLPPRSPAPLHAYGFHLSDYDPTQPLIIDPAMLVYAGFVGGSGDDRGQDIAVDSAGSVYITGFTDSPQATFPETVGPDLTYNSGIYDAFVAKINPAGTALVYAGYIGGSGNDDGYGIAVDDTGSAYITGLTDSAETQGFPVIAGPDLTYNGDISPDPRGDAFIAKVNPSGTALLYAGYIGGSMAEVGFGIALDSSNQAYVVGLTNSRENSSPNPFPVAVGPDLTHNDPGVIGDSFDAFIVKVTANGSGFNYAGYIGGSADDRGYDVAVDSAGNAYVSGETQSDQATFPTSIGPDLTHNGGRDAFVAKVNPSGAGLVYAGYLGGGNDDAGSSIVVDSAEAAYLAGETYSDQTTFPETVGPDLTFGGVRDAFAAKIRPDGSGLDYAGYIGGSGDETGRGVAIDSAGNAYVTGYTASADFPASVGPDLSHNGGLDVFIAKLNTAGSGFSYAGFIGGSGNDDGWEIAVDNAGSAYLTGQTDSTETSFPETGGLDLSYNGGILDAFVAKITSNVRVTATGPVSNALNITPTANVTATFSDDITPTTITSRTFVVHGDLTGRYTQTLSYSAPSRTVTLNPPGAFKPGEVMMVSAASGISSTTGISLTPYVWQFWAAATGGSGNFVPHPTTPNFDSGNNTTDSTDVALGDIDGDGDLDAIIANANASTQAETVWRNDGLGNFTPHPTVPSFGSDQSSEVVLGDLDGDGDLDAVVSNYDNQPETTWLNNGTGVFTQHLTIPSFSSGSYSSGIGVGDVNSDGYLDVVVANYNGQGETVWLNNGTGGFTQHPTTPNFGVGSNSGDVVLGDLNGDGTLDAIVANRLNEAETVWLNDGRGNFTPHSPASFGAGDSFTVALGDINGDGDLDALVANQGQTETVWMNDGAGVFTNSSSFDAGSDSTDVALGDIDGDGDLDAVIANAFNQTETVWINNGTGSFSAHPTIPSFGTGDSQAVALGDIDGDGDLDVLIANYSSQAETVWLNQNPANLAITKTDSPDPVSAGATLTYTLRITNTGPTTATYLLVTDTLPSGVAFVSISGAGWNCGQGGGVVTCTRPSLGVGAAPTIVITTTAPIAAGVITNTATVTGAVIDAVMGNNTVTVTTTVSPVTTLVVNSANDADDGTCNVTHCSLREAINAANALPGSQTITFNIPGVGPHTISPNSALPYITDPVTIDGSTQPGASCASWPPTLRIELNGSNAGPGAVGLVIFAGNSVIRGLVINRFGEGIFVGVSTTPTNDNIIECNFIGTDISGTADLGNLQYGLEIFSSNNIIGGTTAGAGNLISGNGFSGISISGINNSNGNLVRGNFIGTDVNGIASLSNGRNGVDINSSSGNIIGGTAAGARNLISGNNQAGILIQGPATGNQMQGNFIGTDISGTAALGNGSGGVIFSGGSGNIIGGVSAGAGNTIAYNGDVGVLLGSGSDNGNAVLSNTVFANANLGIDLDPAGVTPNDLGDGDTGPNNLQNFPVLTSVSSSGGNTTIQGTLNSVANTAFTLQFFANAACDPSGYGEGETLLGSATTTTNAGGNAAFSVTLPVTVALGQFVTATATDPANNTSEFSQCLSFTSADLTLTKSDSPDPVNAGATLTYTVRVTNTGPLTATAITVSDTLPTGVTFVDATGTGWSCSQAAGIVTCTRPSLSVGVAPNIVITTTAPLTGGIITNTATLISSTLDPTTPNTAVATTTVRSLVQFSSPTYTVAENAGTATITATLNAPSNLTVTVVYATSDGTAIAPGDYTAASGVLTFTPGQTSRTFSVPILPDSLDENDETVNLTLSSPANATLGSPNPAILTITDDDPTPTVQFSAANYSITENAGTATITTTLSAASGLTVTVAYATSNGTALAPGDYTTSSGTLTFAPGQTSRTFTVPIVNDALFELNETVTLTLSAPVSATLGSPNPATLTITNDDPTPTVQFSAASYNVAENTGTTIITATLNAASGLTVTVNYATSNGTAIAGSDYTSASGTLTFAPGVITQTFSVPITNDLLFENNETVLLTLSAPVSATLSIPNPATLTITNDDLQPSFQFSTASYNVAENVGTATITVTLSAASGLTATVNYATSNGTATAPGDYTAASGTLTFTPGQTSRTFTVPIVNDSLVETNETVNLTLSSPTNAVISGTNPATLTIVDNDSTQAQFSTASYSVSENAGSATITATLSAASSLTVTVAYATSNGTALAPGDYTASSGTLTFAPGQTSQSFAVAIANDALFEVDETVNLTLSTPVNANLGLLNPASLTITNDDPQPAIQFSSNSGYSVNENAGTAAITVTLSAVSGLTTTVNYATSNGTAIAGSDYVTASGGLTFAPGQTQQAFSVSITDDSLVEANETVLLTLSNPVNASLSPANSVTLTLMNDDNPAAYRVYLPLIMRNALQPIKLSIKNETGGVLQYSIFGTPQGNITCQNIPNGSTVFCSEFLSGVYQTTATSTGPGCGSTTVVLDFPAGVCTRIVRCGVPSLWQCQ